MTLVRDAANMMTLAGRRERSRLQLTKLLGALG